MFGIVAGVVIGFTLGMLACERVLHKAKKFLVTAPSDFAVLDVTKDKEGGPVEGHLFNTPPQQLLEYLPPWVEAPDHKTARWLNTMLHTLWPSMSRATLKVVQQTVNDMTPQLKAQVAAATKGKLHLTQLDLQHFSLGPSPTIAGWKTYETPAHEVVLDVRVHWGGGAIGAGDTGNDHVDIRVQGSVQCGPIAFVAPLAVTDLQVQATVRITLGPLIETMPVVGAVKVSLMGPPHIGMGLRFDGHDSPDIFGMVLGLDTLKDAVLKRVLGTMLQYPHAIAFDVIDGGGRPTKPAGLLCVEVQRAEKLPSGWFDTVDPFVQLEVRNGRPLKTSDKENTHSPEWNETATFVVDDPDSQALQVHVIDHDVISDSLLGKNIVTLSKSACVRHPGQPVTYTLHLKEPNANLEGAVADAAKGAVAGAKSAATAGVSTAKTAAGTGVDAAKSAVTAGVSSAKSAADAGVEAARSAADARVNSAKTATTAGINTTNSAAGAGVSAGTAAAAAGLSAGKEVAGQVVGQVGSLANMAASNLPGSSFTRSNSEDVSQEKQPVEADTASARRQSLTLTQSSPVPSTAKSATVAAPAAASQAAPPAAEQAPAPDASIEEPQPQDSASTPAAVRSADVPAKDTASHAAEVAGDTAPLAVEIAGDKKRGTLFMQLTYLPLVRPTTQPDAAITAAARNVNKDVKGVLTVKVVRCIGLESDEADPFVKLLVDDPLTQTHQQLTTQTRFNDSNPRYDEVFDMVGISAGSTLMVSVWDGGLQTQITSMMSSALGSVFKGGDSKESSDSSPNDGRLGWVPIPVKEVADNAELKDVWLLRDAVKGKIELQLSWTSLPGYDDLIVPK